MPRKFGPVVAGKFYPRNKQELLDRIENCYTHDFGPGSLPEVSEDELSYPAGLIAPHAGYPYSGPVAAHSFNWVAGLGKPEVVVIVGTNHSGLGSAASLVVEGSWSTPLGRVEFDQSLARSILDSSKLLDEDASAFRREHSIEVQLPFLQNLWEDEFSIVPICLKNQSEEVAEDVGSALEESVPDSTLIIASTDFTHYEPQETAEQKDGRAIETIMSREITAFYDVVREQDISICGYGSIGVLLEFALEKHLLPKKLKYATSGEVAGYGREVVGYGAIGFRK